MAINCVRLCTLTALLAMTAVGSIQADEFGFFIGSGGHGGGHHHHHHRGGWGIGYSSWYPPPPRYVYVQPPPVIQERVYVQPQVVQERIIVQPQAVAPAPITYAPSTLSRANSLPAPPNRDTVDSPVVVRNAAGKNAPVAFLVDSKDEELGEGQTRTFSGSGNRVIEFDRGGDRGTARYELSGGVYSFVVTGNGWDLVKETGVPQTAKRSVLRRNELPAADEKLR